MARRQVQSKNKSVKKKIKRPIGRPAHVPNAKLRRIVEECASANMSIRNIARSIGISWKTLELYYEEELLTGKARKQQEAIALLYRSARQGNVSAQRKIYAIAFGEDSGGEASTTPVEGEEDKPKAKIGKKELVQLEADSIKGIYAPPDPPKLVVDNSK